MHSLIDRTFSHFKRTYPRTRSIAPSLYAERPCPTASTIAPSIHNCAYPPYAVSYLSSASVDRTSYVTLIAPSVLYGGSHLPYVVDRTFHMQPVATSRRKDHTCHIPSIALHLYGCLYLPIQSMALSIYGRPHFLHVVDCTFHLRSIAPCICYSRSHLPYTVDRTCATCRSIAPPIYGRSHLPCAVDREFPLVGSCLPRRAQSLRLSYIVGRAFRIQSLASPLAVGRDFLKGGPHLPYKAQPRCLHIRSVAPS